MLRFQPDGWLEGLLRPLILIDPAAGIYFERAAPDFRFAGLALFVFIAWAARRGRWGFGVEPTRALLLLVVCFYVWTFVIGNARYFAFGLLLVGPLLVMVWRRFPGTGPFRAIALLLICGLQVYAVHSNYRPNEWGLARWFEGPALSLGDAPVRHQPGIFFTTTTISYSALVPLFHPDSSWVNVAGQIDLTPKLPEFERVQHLLRTSELPRYVLAPILPKFMDTEGQPLAEVRQYYDSVVANLGLVSSPAPCTALWSTLPTGLVESREGGPPKRGFWVCPLELAAGAGPAVVTPLGARALHVFERIEAACPRFFPPQNGVDRVVDGVALRHYAGSDMRLFLDANDRVAFRYFRAVNPTYVATGSEVLEGRFQIHCDKVDGRYRWPWARDQRGDE